MLFESLSKKPKGFFYIISSEQYNTCYRNSSREKHPINLSEKALLFSSTVCVLGLISSLEEGSKNQNYNKLKTRTMLAARTPIAKWANCFWTIQVILHDVRCQGVERNISQCKHQGWRRSECNHYEDVGVKCHAPQLQGHPVITTACIDLETSSKIRN